MPRRNVHGISSTNVYFTRKVHLLLFVLVSSQPVLDPPVTMEKAIHLNDDNNDTCLVLAQTDMYTWSAGAHRLSPQPQGKNIHSGLVINRCVPEAIKASFTVTITGRHLVCSISAFDVSIRQTKWSYSETSGLYRKCEFSGSTGSRSNGLTTCVAKCICDGDDCKHVIIEIPKAHELWEICEIDIK